MASMVLQGDTSGSVTLTVPAVAGSNTINLPAQSGNLALNQAVVVTDSTDVLIAGSFASNTQTNLGNSFSLNIPQNGIIRLASMSFRMLTTASAVNHYLVVGLRINSTNYWFGNYKTNGTFNTSNLTVSYFKSPAAANTAYDVYGPSNTNFDFPYMTLDISNLSIPTGTQTVQFIVSGSATQGTLKGTVMQTRAFLEFLAP